MFSEGLRVVPATDGIQAGGTSNLQPHQTDVTGKLGTRLLLAIGIRSGKVGSLVGVRP